MRITKFGHACVRMEHDGVVVVVDPGGFTDPGAVDGAGAVLITHEHADHYAADRLAATDAPIFTIEAVAAQIRQKAPGIAERVTVVGPGDSFDVGVPVRAVGELHAVIHPDFDRFHNSGYVLTLGDQRVYHPGDALTAPDERVDVLCAPVSAPWLKVSEALDFVRLVGAARNLAVHDRIYTEVAHGIVEGHMARFLDGTGQEFVRLPDGADLADA